MKNIFLIFGVILSFLFPDKVSAQTIGLSGPTTAVASGTNVVLPRQVKLEVNTLEVFHYLWMPLLTICLYLT